MTVRVMAQKSGVTAEDHRFALQADLVPAGALNARAGVFPNGTTPADLVSVSALAAKVTPFQAFIDGTSNALQAGYRFTSDADVTLTFAVGNGVNPRIDLVVARVRDDPYDTSGVQTGAVEIVAGTPAGSPAAPAVPASSLALWQVLVPANASGGNPIVFASARTDRRAYTGVVGAPFPVASAAERNAVTSPYDGMAVYRTDTKQIEVYDGTTWRIHSANAVVPTLIPFTASGTLTAGQVTGAKALRVRVVGGGGAGGGAPATGAAESSGGGGGQGGHYAESVIPLTSITFPVTVTVGAGGPGVSGAPGNAGATSSFGTYVTAGGGAGGAVAATGAVVGISAQGGLAAAAAMVGQILASGSDGVTGWRFTATAFAPGAGGSSALGGALMPLGFSGNLQGLPGKPYGGGGAGSSRGASAGALLGGAGAAGVVLVEPIY